MPPSRDEPVSPLLSIVVVNYGSSGLLARNLVETQAATSDALVVVVDNRTTDAERDAVAQLGAEHGWLVIFADENLGFGAGVNLGVAAARDAGASQHLLLNPDARIDGESVRTLRAAATAEPGPAIAAPVVRDGTGRQWSAGSVLDLADGATHSATWASAHPERRTRPWLTAAVLLVDDDAWEAAGGFDEEYFLYWEDVDFSFRVADAGGRLIVVPEASAVHDEGGTHGGGDPAKRAKSATYYYYNIRNRMLFAVKRLSVADARRWDAASLRAAREVVLRGGRRQLLWPWSALGAARRGVRDARQIVRRMSG